MNCKNAEPEFRISGCAKARKEIPEPCEPFWRMRAVPETWDSGTAPEVTVHLSPVWNDNSYPNPEDNRGIRLWEKNLRGHEKRYLQEQLSL